MVKKVDEPVSGGGGSPVSDSGEKRKKYAIGVAVAFLVVVLILASL